MTVFDTLRYQISSIPTAGELHALPDDLFQRWRMACGFPLDWTSADVSEWFGRLKLAADTNYTTGQSNLWVSQIGEVIILRRMIAEYHE